MLRHHKVIINWLFFLALKLLIKRSIASTITMTLYMAPIQFIHIGVAATLFNTGPLMGFFIEALYYKTVIMDDNEYRNL